MNIAASPPPISERLSAEFVGLARGFRGRVLDWAQASGPVMRSITGAAIRTLKRRQAPLRPEHLTEIERQWMATCNPGCLAVDVRRDRKSLTIADVRVTAAVVNYNLGNEMVDENGISIIVNGLNIGTTTIASDSLTVAAVSIHGLGRRFQRGFGNATDTAILRDLRALADGIQGLATDKSFIVAAPSGGAWRGFSGPMAADGRTVQIANVRTFV